MAKLKKTPKSPRKVLRMRSVVIDGTVNGCNTRAGRRPPSDRLRAKEHGMSAKFVERDLEHFRLLFTNSLPKMPEGFQAPLQVVATREQIAKRLQAQKTA